MFQLKDSTFIFPIKKKNLRKIHTEDEKSYKGRCKIKIRKRNWDNGPKWALFYALLKGNCNPSKTNEYAGKRGRESGTRKKDLKQTRAETEYLSLKDAASSDLSRSFRSCQSPSEWICYLSLARRKM